MAAGYFLFTILKRTAVFLLNLIIILEIRFFFYERTRHKTAEHSKKIDDSIVKFFDLLARFDYEVN